MKMMLYWIMFSEVISVVIISFILIYVELFLCMPFPQPMIVHILQFGSLLANIFMNKTFRCGIVSLDRYRWLRVVKFLKYIMNGKYNLCIVKYTSGFYFSRGGDYMFKCSTFH